MNARKKSTGSKRSNKKRNRQSGNRRGNNKKNTGNRKKNKKKTNNLGRAVGIKNPKPKARKPKQLKEEKKSKTSLFRGVHSFLQF